MCLWMLLHSTAASKIACFGELRSTAVSKLLGGVAKRSVCVCVMDFIMTK
jgi:hypothetical protein